eukprot:m.523039 g.523039  ORF g.523039 m.523039 type:complete len:53 (+) comp21973_c0_seq9:2573-2731(+)
MQIVMRCTARGICAEYAIGNYCSGGSLCKPFCDNVFQNVSKCTVTMDSCADQ